MKNQTVYDLVICFPNEKSNTINKSKKKGKENKNRNGKKNKPNGKNVKGKNNYDEKKKSDKV